MKITLCLCLSLLLMAPFALSITITVPGDYATIQEAIDAATDNDLIQVANGTYIEQLTIDGKILEIKGANINQTIIQSPDVLVNTFFTDGSTTNKCLVGVINGGDLTMSGFTINGAWRGAANYRFHGVGFNNAGGRVGLCKLKNFQDSPISGLLHGNCIYIYNDNGTDYTVRLDYCTCLAYQNGGIVVNGANAIALVTGCILTGIGPDLVTTQNGIQFALGARGQVDNCIIENHCYLNTDKVSTGILVYNAGLVEITNCFSITDNEVGTYFISSDGYFINNTINAGVNSQDSAGNYVGLAIDAICERCAPPNVFDGSLSGTSGAGVLNTGRAVKKVVAADCRFYADRSGNGTGIGVWGTLVDEKEASIISSEIWGWTLGIDVWQEASPSPLTSVKVYFCDIQYNDLFALNNVANSQVDAEYNWWGDKTGPFESTTNPTGLGDSVTTNVDFEPWLTFDETFTANRYIMDVSEGGSVNFTLDAGPANGGRLYLVLASMSGSTPGTPLPGGVTLPINWDTFTDFALNRINTPNFLTFMGFLNSSGFATAQLRTQSLNPTKIGKILTCAFILEAVGGNYDFTSNPVEIEFVD